MIKVQPDKMMFSIPDAIHCDTITFIWPKTSALNEHCYCLVINTDRHFDACAQWCKSEYDARWENGSIIFRNISTNSDNFIAHFVCNEDPCLHSSCFLNSVITSHRITLTSKCFNIINHSLYTIKFKLLLLSDPFTSKPSTNIIPSTAPDGNTIWQYFIIASIPIILLMMVIIVTAAFCLVRRCAKQDRASYSVKGSYNNEIYMPNEVEIQQ